MLFHTCHKHFLLTQSPLKLSLIATLATSNFCYNQRQPVYDQHVAIYCLQQLECLLLVFPRCCQPIKCRQPDLTVLCAPPFGSDSLLFWTPNPYVGVGNDGSEHFATCAAPRHDGSPRTTRVPSSRVVVCHSGGWAAVVRDKCRRCFRLTENAW